MLKIKYLWVRMLVIVAALAGMLVSAPGGALAEQPWASRPGKWIEVNLSRQSLTAWQNGKAVLRSAISSGVRAHPTRPGTFHIYAKYRSTRMTGPDYDLPNVPYTMYYSGSFALHGTYWHHNFGHPMSHGCVNLPTGKAAWLFGWAGTGTTVVIHY